MWITEVLAHPQISDDVFYVRKLLRMATTHLQHTNSKQQPRNWNNWKIGINSTANCSPLQELQVHIILIFSPLACIKF